MCSTIKWATSTLLFSCFFLISSGVNAQQRIKLTPVAASPHLGYVDLVRLHQEYVAQNAARKNLLQQWQTAESQYKYEEGQQAKKLREQLLNDSLQGGSNRKELELAGQRVSDSLVATWKQLQQDFMEKRNKIAHAFDKKIADTIREVIREGGFTEVKTLKKGESAINGTDITGLILQKLH